MPDPFLRREGHIGESGKLSPTRPSRGRQPPSRGKGESQGGNQRSAFHPWSDSRRESLDVAVAVIEREGRYLITQRLPDDSFGGRWEFPGGKLEPGEGMEAALVREIQEELGIAITVGPKLKEIEHRYPNRTIRLHCFLCRILAGEPQRIECSDLRWVDSSELPRFEFPPASGPIIEVLIENPRLHSGHGSTSSP